MEKDVSHGHDIFMFDLLQHTTFFFTAMYREAPHSDDVRRGTLLLRRDNEVGGPRVPNIGHVHHVVVFLAKSYAMAFPVLFPRGLVLHDQGILRPMSECC